jgi:hypothetical protein
MREVHLSATATGFGFVENVEGETHFAILTGELIRANLRQMRRGTKTAPDPHASELHACEEGAEIGSEQMRVGLNYPSRL